MVIPQIEALVAEHPLREAFRAQLMIAFYRTGRQADALRIVREYRQVLVEELGLDPSPVVTDLERRILNHDPTLMLAEPGGVPLRGYRLGERLGTGRDGTVYRGAPAWGRARVRHPRRSARTWPMTPSSCGRSRPLPIEWRRCATRPSLRSTTTGENRGRRTWSCAGCMAGRSATACIAAR